MTDAEQPKRQQQLLWTEAARELSKLGASKGGQARANNLTPERRSEIARRAVEARWSKKKGRPETPTAAYTGLIKIGELEIECAVLDSGERVLSQRGFMAALGIKHGGQLATSRVDKEGGAKLPMFVGQKHLRPFIDKDLASVLTNPIKYYHPQSGSTAFGVKAELIPQVCDVWLKARDAGVLRLANQLATAAKADILVRGLAHVGIVAMVDEATGYQDYRARNALAQILEAFVAKEIRKWIKTFPPDFYKELFRLRGLLYTGAVRRPAYIGHLTNDIVYSRLAPGVLAELRRRNPVDDDGRRQYKHHQWLTPNIGHPRLLEHLAAVTALMRASLEWTQFKKMLDRALPKQISLPLFDQAQSESEDITDPVQSTQLRVGE